MKSNGCHKDLTNKYNLFKGVNFNKTFETITINDKVDGSQYYKRKFGTLMYTHYRI